MADQAVLACQPVDERAEPDTLHHPGDRDALAHALVERGHGVSSHTSISLTFFTSASSTPHCGDRASALRGRKANLHSGGAVDDPYLRS